MPEPYVERMLVISTGNIKETTSVWIDANVSCKAIWLKDDYGWFLYGTESWHDAPADLIVALELAWSVGCDWLMIDRDALAHPNLPEYDW